MSLPYEDMMASTQWCDKEPAPKKHKDENDHQSPSRADQKEEPTSATSNNEPNETEDTKVHEEQDGEKDIKEENKSDSGNEAQQRTESRRKKSKKKRPAPPARKWNEPERRGPGIRYWQRKQFEKRVQPWEERKDIVSQRRERAVNDQLEEEAATEQRKEEKVVDSDDDETKKKKAAPEKAKNDIAIRKAPSVAEGPDDHPEQQANDKPEEEGETKTSAKQPFPTRLWQPKRDYSGDKQKKDDDELEAKRENSAKNGCRIPPPKVDRSAPAPKAFVTPVHDAAFDSRLPDVIDFRYLPKKPEAEVEATVERLVKPVAHKPEKYREPTPPLTEEAQEQLIGRLRKPNREYAKEAEEKPKHSIIKPVVLEEEEVERIFERLSTPQATSQKKKFEFHSHAGDIPKFDPEKQKEVVDRLHDTKYLSKREEKALELAGGVRGDGWSPERHKDSFHQKFDQRNFS